MVSTTTTRKRRNPATSLLLAAAIFSASIAASGPSSLAFASGNYNGGDVEISDRDDVSQTNVQLSDQTATIDSDNKIKGDNSSVTNTIGQYSSQNAANIFEDNDKIKLPKGYDGGSIYVTDDDKVDQTNAQVSDQEATIDSDNKLYDDGSSVDNTIVQGTEQNALNAFFDNDKLHVQKGYEGNIEVCDDDDVSQTNIQSSKQNATIDSDNKIKGNGSTVSNAIGQYSSQNAANIFKDNDKILVKKSYAGDVAVCDNDTVSQTNVQTTEQNATIDSDNKIKGNNSSVSNLIGQSSDQAAANVLKDNDFFKFK